MSHVEFKLALADYATQNGCIARLQALTAACERQPFDAYAVREKYLENCDFIRQLLQNCDHDQEWLSGVEQTESVQACMRTVLEARQSIWRAVTAVECRLVAAGVLGYPGSC
jgi:hypothetical protein